MVLCRGWCLCRRLRTTFVPLRRLFIGMGKLQYDRLSPQWPADLQSDWKARIGETAGNGYRLQAILVERACIAQVRHWISGGKIYTSFQDSTWRGQIGRASCKERV